MSKITYTSIYAPSCPHTRLVPEMQGPAVCPLCNKTKLRGKYKTTYGACAGCCKDEVRSRGRAETLVKQQLQMHGFECIHNKTDPRSGRTISAARADFRIVREGENYDIVIEVDEQMHKQHPPAKEMQRMLDMVRASENRPHLFFRLNPDGYRNSAGHQARGVSGQEYVDSLRTRVEYLLERIQMRERNVARRKKANASFTMPILYIEYLFYDTDSQDPRYQSVTPRQFKTLDDAAKRAAELARR